MNRLLLASLAILPALAGIVRIVGAFRTRSGSRSRSIIMWGALTIVAGVALYAGSALSGFRNVADAPSESKALAMSLVLERGSLALWTAIVAGGLVCVLGGITRSIFGTNVEQKVNAAQITPKADRRKKNQVDDGAPRTMRGERHR